MLKFITSIRQRRAAKQQAMLSIKQVLVTDAGRTWNKSTLADSAHVDQELTDTCVTTLTRQGLLSVNHDGYVISPGARRRLRSELKHLGHCA